MMNLIPRFIAPAALLTCLIGTAALLFDQTQPTPAPAGPARPDAYMESITAVMLDQQGRPKMQLKAPKLVYYAQQDATYLSFPELKLYSKSPQPWLITSQRAIARQGYSAVDFWEDVHIQRTASLTESATLIETSHLLIHPDEKTAETRDSITLTQAHTLIKAVGLFANMDTGNINLLSQTWGEYVPDV